MKHFTLNAKAFLLAIIVMLASTNSYGQKTRVEIPANYKWNLADLFLIRRCMACSLE